MVSFKIYVIFHKNIFRECYADIPEDLFREKITCYAVNEKIQKEYDPWFEPSICKEYELTNYYPQLQALRYCESSAYIHMLINHKQLIEPYDYIGCFHYDMYIKKSHLDYIEEVLTYSTNPSNTVFYIKKAYALYQFGSSYNVDGKEECLVHNGWRIVLQKYNEYYSTSHIYDSIVYDDMPMNHTFLVHKDVFCKMAPFFVSILRRIHEMLDHRPRHLPYVLESLWGLLLLLHKRENPTTRWVYLDIVHDESLKDKDFLASRNLG